jgi:hypothetical protein
MRIKTCEMCKATGRDPHAGPNCVDKLCPSCGGRGLQRVVDIVIHEEAGEALLFLMRAADPRWEIETVRTDDDMVMTEWMMPNGRLFRVESIPPKAWETPPEGKFYMSQRYLLPAAPEQEDAP